MGTRVDLTIAASGGKATFQPPAAGKPVTNEATHPWAGGRSCCAANLRVGGTEPEKQARRGLVAEYLSYHRIVPEQRLAVRFPISLRFQRLVRLDLPAGGGREGELQGNGFFLR